MESEMFRQDRPYYALDWCKYYYLFVVNKRETCQIFQKGFLLKTIDDSGIVHNSVDDSR